jgi:hypothetical protein
VVRSKKAPSAASAAGSICTLITRMAPHFTRIISVGSVCAPRCSPGNYLPGFTPAPAWLNRAFMAASQPALSIVSRRCLLSAYRSALARWPQDIHDRIARDPGEVGQVRPEALLPIPAGGCAAPATAAALVVGTGWPQRSAPALTLPGPHAIFGGPEPRPARGGVLMSAMRWRILHGSIR